MAKQIRNDRGGKKHEAGKSRLETLPPEVLENIVAGGGLITGDPAETSGNINTIRRLSKTMHHLVGTSPKLQRFSDRLNEQNELFSPSLVSGAGLGAFADRLYDAAIPRGALPEGLEFDDDFASAFNHVTAVAPILHLVSDGRDEALTRKILEIPNDDARAEAIYGASLNFEKFKLGQRSRLVEEAIRILKKGEDKDGQDNVATAAAYLSLEQAHRSGDLREGAVRLLSPIKIREIQFEVNHLTLQIKSRIAHREGLESEEFNRDWLAHLNETPQEHWDRLRASSGELPARAPDLRAEDNLGVSGNDLDDLRHGHSETLQKVRGLSNAISGYADYDRMLEYLAHPERDPERGILPGRTDRAATGEDGSASQNRIEPRTRDAGSSR